MSGVSLPPGTTPLRSRIRREETDDPQWSVHRRADHQRAEGAVPSEWVFEDEGYSGASLIRPGLEQVRDLAAEGHLDAVLVYAPDRLSRRYAYQVLLIEVFARAGAETLIIRSPRGGISGFPLSFRVVLWCRDRFLMLSAWMAS